MLDPLKVIPDEIYARRELRYRDGALKRREMSVPLTCPNCNNERWLSIANARYAIRNSCFCFNCAQRVKYLKAVEIHGAEKLKRKILEAVAKRPLNRYEQMVALMLEQVIEAFDLSFAAQVIAEPFVLDFALYYQGRIVGVIEVNGYHHNLFRAARDEQVIKLFNMEVLFIHTNQLRRNPALVREALVTYLQGVQNGTKR